eukprot:1606295-Rhodomonas_salina.1
MVDGAVFDAPPLTHRMRDLRERLMDCNNTETLSARDRRKFTDLRGSVRDLLSACKYTMAGTNKWLRAYFRGLPTEELAREVGIRFKKFDTNCDGLLNEKEVMDGMVEMGLKCTLEEMEALFATYDPEETGEVGDVAFESMVRVKLGRRPLPLTAQETAEFASEEVTTVAAFVREKLEFETGNDLPSALAAAAEEAPRSGVAK